MANIVIEAANLTDAILGDEDNEESFNDQAGAMIGLADTNPAPLLILASHCIPHNTHTTTITRQQDTSRQVETAARLEAAYAKDIRAQEPRTRWMGGENHGVVPISNPIQQFSTSIDLDGVHVLDLFGGITFGGLRTILATGKGVTTYASVEIDDTSRANTRCVISQIQEEYLGQLPDDAIRGYNKCLLQDIQFVGEANLTELIDAKGPIHFICGGRQCQSMSLTGNHCGMEDERFLPFLDMVRLVFF